MGGVLNNVVLVTTVTAAFSKIRTNELGLIWSHLMPGLTELDGGLELWASHTEDCIYEVLSNILRF